MDMMFQNRNVWLKTGQVAALTAAGVSCRHLEHTLNNHYKCSDAKNDFYWQSCAPRMSQSLSSHFTGGWDQCWPEPQFSVVMLAPDCRQKERSKETTKKENKIISGTVVSGSRDRHHCATIIYMRGKTAADKIHSPERGQCDTILSPGSCSSYPPVPRRLQWSHTYPAESQRRKKT